MALSPKRPAPSAIPSVDFLLHDFGRAGKFCAVKTHVGVAPGNFPLRNATNPMSINHQSITPLIDRAISPGRFRVLEPGCRPRGRVGHVCSHSDRHTTEILACDFRAAPTNGACEEKDNV
jgi:hypothetical protein